MQFCTNGEVTIFSAALAKNGTLKKRYMRMDLIGESPEAQAFFRTVESNIGSYLLFPDERFTTISAGILTASVPDLQNEIIDPDCLEDMAAKINKDSMWMLREHNPLLGIVGRVLAAGAILCARIRGLLRSHCLRVV